MGKYKLGNSYNIPHSNLPRYHSTYISQRGFTAVDSFSDNIPVFLQASRQRVEDLGSQDIGDVVVLYTLDWLAQSQSLLGTARARSTWKLQKNYLYD